MEGFGPNIDKQYAVPAHLSFRQLEDFRLTYGYAALEAAQASTQRRLAAMFFPIPNAINDKGRVSEYVVFVNCEDAEMIRTVYTVGARVTVSFEAPPPQQRPEGWRAEIKPPLPGIECPGTLVLHMRRPYDDDRTIPVKTSFDSKTDLDAHIWMYPEVSDLSTKRLVNCANLLSVVNYDLKDIQRCAVGRDLRVNTDGHNLFDGFDLENPDPETKAIMSRWDPSQLKTFHHMVKTKLPMVLIQGPPGTGKTFFLKDLVKILTLRHYKTLVAAPSNVGVDTLATAIEENYSEVGAIRYHSYEREKLSIRRHGREDQYPPPVQPKVAQFSNAKDNISKDTEQKVEQHSDAKATSSKDAVESDLAFQRLVLDILNDKNTWQSVKRQRPNTTTMGLYVRALQLSKVATGNAPVLDTPQDDQTYNEFRRLFTENAVKSEFEEDKTTYKSLEKALYTDTLGKARGGCYYPPYYGRQQLEQTLPSACLHC